MPTPGREAGAKPLVNQGAHAFFWVVVPEARRVKLAAPAPGEDRPWQRHYFLADPFLQPRATPVPDLVPGLTPISGKVTIRPDCR